MQLASTLVRRELAPGQLVLAAGEMSQAITIIAYGTVGASISADGDPSNDVVRFGPREYFGESGPVAGVASRVSYAARTYVIAYELPRHAVTNLLKQHSDVAHALAATLVARERKGHALMQPVEEIHHSGGGLVDWIHRCIKSIHHRHA
jgi:CRP-like cAMP-binding protein